MALVGGHSIEDPEIKYGLAVTGLIHPKKILSNANAKVGDKLVLTKALGTGIIATALKGQMASEEAVRKITESMVTLNRTASEWMVKLGAHACTDITGFSFIGHALEMATASQVGLLIHSEAIPIFPEAVEYAKIGLVPGGAHSNRQFFSCKVEMSSKISNLLVDVLYDPQTSGGLLISLPPSKAEELVAALKKDGHVYSCIVGEVVREPPGKIQLL
ncbi:MAG: selenide, water dikinase SelD [Deltaproteobacteria bacterium]|nr:selenide, water dikinase SelD [Deltaproteobacteria bacterium]